jgi:hypothetical protein
MTLVRVGLSDKKYATGYDAIFGGKKKAKKPATAARPAKKKKAPKK